MRLQVIITMASHYDMGDNKGLSVHVVGDKAKTNNYFGQVISEATVPDYNELQYLLRFQDNLPARFNANLSIGTKKLANGKQGSAVSLSNLEFLNEVEWADKKVTVKA